MRLEQVKVAGRGTIRRTPILFVHGICHGAWCWQYWQSWFAGQGRTTMAVSLRGHGESEGRSGLDSFTLDDYVEDVIRTADGMSQPPVLIGHSMGGAVVQKAFAKYPDAFRAVVLLASMPPNGMTKTEQFTLLARPRGLGAFRKLLAGGELSGKEMQRLPFFDNRLETEALDLALKNLQPESKAVLDELDTIALGKPTGELPPVLVIGSKKDVLFGRSALERTAAFYRASLILQDEGCHDLMLDPVREQTAREVECWLSERKL